MDHGREQRDLRCQNAQGRRSWRGIPGEKALVFSGSLSPAARGLLEYDSARSAEEKWETGTERRPVVVRRPLLPPPARRKLRDPRAPGASHGGALPVLVGGRLVGAEARFGLGPH